MARTKIHRNLTPLPRRASSKDARHDPAGIRQILRALAVKNQREQPRTFYSLREVSKNFRVPVSRIAKIYRELEEEGLLSRVRGSKTVLNGQRYNRRRVRAFIGLPALISAFITIPDYRAFLNSIRRELSLRGFAATMVFHEIEEAIDGRLAEQFRSYGADAVVWLSPARSAQESLLRLADMGIRVAAVSQIGTPVLPSRYYLWRERGIDRVLRDWRDHRSVRKTIVIDSKDYRSPVTEEILRVLLETLQMQVTVHTFGHGLVHEFVRDLSRLKSDGIIFPSAALASMFSFQNPEAFANLVRSNRVAFIDGPVDTPFAEAPDSPVDLVTFDWPAVAETIVNDLVTLEAFDRNRHTTFESDAQLRVPLSRFGKSIIPSRGAASV
jgi:hypothetical protein